MRTQSDAEKIIRCECIAQPGDVSDINVASGEALFRQDQSRYSPVEFSVRGRDPGGAVRQAVARLKHCGADYDRVDSAAVSIRFGSVRDALNGASVMPMALASGIVALFVTGTSLSVSAAIGFIGLFEI